MPSRTHSWRSVIICKRWQPTRYHSTRGSRNPGDATSTGRRPPLSSTISSRTQLWSKIAAWLQRHASSSSEWWCLRWEVAGPQEAQTSSEQEPLTTIWRVTRRDSKGLLISEESINSSRLLVELRYRPPCSDSSSSKHTSRLTTRCRAVALTGRECSGRKARMRKISCHRVKEFSKIQKEGEVALKMSSYRAKNWPSLHEVTVENKSERARIKTSMGSRFKWPRS